jgi:predicted site-specific integrase-resolvase
MTTPRGAHAPKTKKRAQPKTRQPKPRRKPKAAAEPAGQKRTAIYARVSTREQNPDMQIQDLRRYAEARGFTVTHEFVDHESGTKESRPE